ncbi:MAG: aminotransferase class I/II-fold pyridoxal phosphate-dependent enzyme, partial [Proteobacteria bacterium]|nr:aminotransferase class I/II-fold pyridoxal phosphate-dependent enzyme [Pseudomonadota bacterium]
MSSPIITLADRVINIKPSPTLAVNAKAKALKAAGADILNFSVGEPDFDTPPHVCEAGKKAIDEGFTRYTAVPGMPELREAICQRIKIDKGLSYAMEEIQVACGGKHGLYNMFQAVINPGDEVLIPTPYWVSYPPMVQLAGGTPVLVPLLEQDDFDLNPEILHKYATSKTRAIIINSPSNPTGSVFSIEALQAIAKMALENGWLIITDDIYDTITYMDTELPHILEVDDRLKEQTLILNGVSKSFAMTGWRIGWTAGPKHIIAAMNKIQG